MPGTLYGGQPYLGEYYPFISSGGVPRGFGGIRTRIMTVATRGQIKNTLINSKVFGQAASLGLLSSPSPITKNQSHAIGSWVSPNMNPATKIGNQEPRAENNQAIPVIKNATNQTSGRVKNVKPSIKNTPTTTRSRII